MSDLFGLNHDVRESIQLVFSKHPLIQKALIYGSRAKGNFKLGSDIDISLIAPSMNLVELLQIENEIDDLYLPYKIDLSLLHQIENTHLVEHIQRVGQIFYEGS